MASYSSPFQRSSFSFCVWPLLAFALLFNCSFSESADATFPLSSYACAKENAGLYGGAFTLLRDNRLRVDPSLLPTNNDKAKVDALRLDAMDKRLIMSVVFPNGDANCRSFFTAHVQLPNGCAIDKDVSIVNGDIGPDHIGEVCGVGKCALMNVTCNLLLMTPVEGLSDARHFTMTLWKNASKDDSHKCGWKAFLDDVILLLNKAQNRPESVVEQCWENDAKTDTSATNNFFFYAIIGVVIIAVSLIVVCAVVLIYRRTRKSPVSHMDDNDDNSPPKKKKTMRQPKIVDQTDTSFGMSYVSRLSSTSGHSVAAEFGVEVPESMLSATVDDDDYKSDEPKPKAVKKWKNRTNKYLAKAETEDDLYRVRP